MKTPHKVIEEGVDEFEKRFGSFTFENGGTLDFTLWDVVDERVHPKDEVGVVMQDWLRTYSKKLVEVTREEALQEAVDLSDHIERREPDGGTKQWMAFKAFRNTLRDKIETLTKDTPAGDTTNITE